MGTVLGRSGFALATDALIRERAVRSATRFALGVESVGPRPGPSMHPVPRPGLVPQFGVVRPQFVDVLAQVENFATKWPRQFVPISRLGGRNGLNKRAVQTQNAWNADPTSKEGPTGAE